MHKILFSKMLNEYGEALHDEVLRKNLIQIDALVCVEDPKVIQQGVDKLFSESAVLLCRYVYLNDSFLSIRTDFNILNVVEFSQILLQKIENSLYWKELYRIGTFDRIRFFSLGKTPIENLSPREKSFCLDIAKKMIPLPAGDFVMNNSSFDPEDESDLPSKEGTSYEGYSGWKISGYAIVLG